MVYIHTSLLINSVSKGSKTYISLSFLRGFSDSAIRLLSTSGRDASYGELGGRVDRPCTVAKCVT